MGSGAGKKKTAGNGSRKIVIYFTALTVTFMLFFTLGFKFAADSSIMKANASIIDIAPDDRIQVLVPMGSGTADIAKILADKGIISSVLFFRIISNFNG